MNWHEGAAFTVKVLAALVGLLVAARGDYVLWAAYGVFLAVLVGLVVWLDKPKERHEKDRNRDQ